MNIIIISKLIFKKCSFIQIQDISKALKAQEEMLANSKKRIVELEELKQKYTNLNSLESEEAVLSKFNFLRKKREKS